MKTPSRKNLLVLLTVLAMLTAGAGCTSKEATQNPPEHTEIQEVTENTKPPLQDIIIEDPKEMVTYENRYFSFQYDSSTLEVNETMMDEETNSFLISVDAKGDEITRPRLDFLSVDTSGLADAFTEKEFEAFATELISAYYTKDVKEKLKTTFEHTSIQLGESICLETEVTVASIDSLPETTIFVQVRGLGDSGIISILVQNESPEGNANYRDVIYSLQLLTPHADTPAQQE